MWLLEPCYMLMYARYVGPSVWTHPFPFMEQHFHKRKPIKCSWYISDICFGDVPQERLFGNSSVWPFQHVWYWAPLYAHPSYSQWFVTSGSGTRWKTFMIGWACCSKKKKKNPHSFLSCLGSGLLWYCQHEAAKYQSWQSTKTSISSLKWHFFRTSGSRVQGGCELSAAVCICYILKLCEHVVDDFDVYSYLLCLLFLRNV